jgi:hypothetical protein
MAFHKLPDPTHVDFVDGDRVEVMQFLAPLFHRNDQIGFFQQNEVLGHRLTTHVMVLAEFAERQARLLAQSVEQLPAAGIGEGLEHFVFISNHTRQYATCWLHVNGESTTKIAALMRLPASDLNRPISTQLLSPNLPTQ